MSVYASATENSQFSNEEGDSLSDEFYSTRSETSSVKKGTQKMNACDGEKKVGHDESRLDVEAERSLAEEEMEGHQATGVDQKAQETIKESKEENNLDKVPAINHSMSELTITSSIAGIVEHANKRQYGRTSVLAETSNQRRKETDEGHKQTIEHDDILDRIKQKISLHEEHRIQYRDGSHTFLIQDVKQRNRSTMAKRLADMGGDNKVDGKKKVDVNDKAPVDAREVPSLVSIKEDSDNISVVSRSSTINPPNKLKELHSLATAVSLKLRSALDESKQVGEKDIVLRSSLQQTIPEITNDLSVKEKPCISFCEDCPQIEENDQDVESVDDEEDEREDVCEEETGDVALLEDKMTEATTNKDTVDQDSEAANLTPPKKDNSGDNTDDVVKNIIDDVIAGTGMEYTHEDNNANSIVDNIIDDVMAGNDVEYANEDYKSEAKEENQYDEKEGSVVSEVEDLAHDDDCFSIDTENDTESDHEEVLNSIVNNVMDTIGLELAEKECGQELGDGSTNEVSLIDYGDAIKGSDVGSVDYSIGGDTNENLELDGQDNTEDNAVLDSTSLTNVPSEPSSVGEDEICNVEDLSITNKDPEHDDQDNAEENAVLDSTSLTDVPSEPSDVQEDETCNVEDRSIGGDINKDLEHGPDNAEENAVLDSTLLSNVPSEPSNVQEDGTCNVEDCADNVNVVINPEEESSKKNSEELVHPESLTSPLKSCNIEEDGPLSSRNADEDESINEDSHGLPSAKEQGCALEEAPSDEKECLANESGKTEEVHSAQSSDATVLSSGTEEGASSTVDDPINSNDMSGVNKEGSPLEKALEDDLVESTNNESCTGKEVPPSLVLSENGSSGNSSTNMNESNVLDGDIGSTNSMHSTQLHSCPMDNPMHSFPSHASVKTEGNDYQSDTGSRPELNPEKEVVDDEGSVHNEGVIYPDVESLDETQNAKKKHTPEELLQNASTVTEHNVEKMRGAPGASGDDDSSLVYYPPNASQPPSHTHRSTNTDGNNSTTQTEQAPKRGLASLCCFGLNSGVKRVENGKVKQTERYAGSIYKAEAVRTDPREVTVVTSVDEEGVEQDIVDYNEYLTEVGTTMAMEAALPLQVIHRGLDFHDMEGSAGSIKDADSSSNLEDEISSGEIKDTDSSSNLKDEESPSDVKVVKASSDGKDIDRSLLSCEVMLRHSAVRSIAAQSLTDKMHSGYSVNARGINCKKCCMPLMQLGSQPLECVVCPALEEDLNRVVGDLKDNDWYFQQKMKLEVELEDLKVVAQNKNMASSTARDIEFSACVEKRVLENEIKRMEQDVADAEIKVAQKKSEMSKYQSEVMAESEETFQRVTDALKGKNDAEGTVEEILRRSEKSRLKAEKDYFSLIKKHELAKIRVLDAEGVLKKAIEEHEAALCHLEATKAQLAPARAILDELTLEKEWAVAGAKAILSEQDKNVSALEILKANTEAKVSALSEEEAKSEELLTKANQALSCCLADLDNAIDEADIARCEREKLDSAAAKANAAVDAKLAELNSLVSKMTHDHLDTYGVDPNTPTEDDPDDCLLESVAEDETTSISSRKLSVGKDEFDIKIKRSDDADDEASGIDLTIVDGGGSAHICRGLELSDEKSDANSVEKHFNGVVDETLCIDHTLEHPNEEAEITDGADIEVSGLEPDIMDVVDTVFLNRELELSEEERDMIKEHCQKNITRDIGSEPNTDSDSKGTHTTARTDQEDSSINTDSPLNEHDKLSLSRVVDAAMNGSPDGNDMTECFVSEGTHTTSKLDDEEESIKPESDSNTADMAEERSVQDFDIIEESWEFYLVACSYLKNKREYIHAFNKLKMDPLYPYLSVMEGINDSGSQNTEEPKNVQQKFLEEYIGMTPEEIVEDQVRLAGNALPKLIDICKELAGCLGLKKIGVGPVKEVPAALDKANRKYAGNVLSITDYCRAFIVMEDIAALMALLELLWYSLGPIIRRIKLSTLRDSYSSLPGGYRDCKINLDIEGHICEIQVHLSALWNICDVEGFQYYQSWQESNMEFLNSPFDALDNIGQDKIDELVILAEDKVSNSPLESLQEDQEEVTAEYFALAGLYMRVNLDHKAEIILKRLVELRCNSADNGPYDQETIFLQGYLEKTYRQQGKAQEADEIVNYLKGAAEHHQETGKHNATSSLWSSIINPGEAFDLLIDPNKKEREEEEQLSNEVRISKDYWHRIREDRYVCLKSIPSSSCPAMFNVLLLEPHDY